MSGPGELVVVATPIGNIEDLSPRAVAVLSSCDAICCEDTRHSGQLFVRAGVAARRLVSYHQHNEASRTAEVLGWLEAGERVALVSDAGTPAVSDPGARLVSAAHGAGVRVSVVPGPSAAAAAVSVSGLDASRWRFEGFVPRRGSDRRARLSEIAEAPVPTVLYEAPGRVAELLFELAAVCGGERVVVVCRELTKLHEETWRGTLATAAERFARERARGEFVLVVAAGEASAAPPEPARLAAEAESIVSSGASRRDAVREVAERHKVSTRAVYDALGLSRGTRASPL